LSDVAHIECAIIGQHHFRFLAGADIGSFRFFAFDEAFREADDFIRGPVAGQQPVRTECAFGKDGLEFIKREAPVQDILVQISAQDVTGGRIGTLQHLQLERRKILHLIQADVFVFHVAGRSFQQQAQAVIRVQIFQQHLLLGHMLSDQCDVGAPFVLIQTERLERKQFRHRPQKVDVLVLVADERQRFYSGDDRFEGILEDIRRHRLFHRFLVAGLFLVTVQVQIGQGNHLFFHPRLTFLCMLDALGALQQVSFEDVQLAGQ